MTSLVVPERVAERLSARIEITEDGCWVSQYSVGSHGYAQVGWNENGQSFVTVAHRAMWIAVNGDIPEGMTVDHLCKNRPCINPAHLRLLSNYENSRRNNGNDFELGVCAYGHPDSELVAIRRKSKTGEPRLSMTCGVCKKARYTKYNHKKRGLPKRSLATN
jgi:hypothetical protein